MDCTHKHKQLKHTDKATLYTSNKRYILEYNVNRIITWEVYLDG